MHKKQQNRTAKYAQLPKEVSINEFNTNKESRGIRKRNRTLWDIGPIYNDEKFTPALNNHMLNLWNNRIFKNSWTINTGKC